MKALTMRTVFPAAVLLLGFAWVACSRPQQSEPTIGVTPLSELAADDPPVRPDAGGDPGGEEDAGAADAGDGGDRSYDEQFADDAGTDDEASGGDDPDGDE